MNDTERFLYYVSAARTYVSQTEAKNVKVIVRQYHTMVSSVVGLGRFATYSGVVKVITFGYRTISPRFPIKNNVVFI